MFRGKDIIGFDVDSTGVQIEGLNELARKKGKGEEVENLTAESMAGRLSVSEVMPRKMEIIAPSKSDVQKLSEEYIENISPDMKDVVRTLRKAGKRVVLITGNFHEAVDSLAKVLGLNPRRDVFANNLKFNRDGSYRGYKENNNLMHDNGKHIVVRRLQKRHRVTHVGDSMGDALAGADRFIGYGGAALREPVVEKSELYIPGKSLAPILALELTEKQFGLVKDEGLIQRAQSGRILRRGSQR